MAVAEKGQTDTRTEKQKATTGERETERDRDRDRETEREGHANNCRSGAKMSCCPIFFAHIYLKVSDFRQDCLNRQSEEKQRMVKTAAWLTSSLVFPIGRGRNMAINPNQTQIKFSD